MDQKLATILESFQKYQKSFENMNIVEILGFYMVMIEKMDIKPFQEQDIENYAEKIVYNGRHLAHEFLDQYQNPTPGSGSRTISTQTDNKLDTTTQRFANGWFNAQQSRGFRKTIPYNCYGCHESFYGKDIQYIRVLPWNQKPDYFRDNKIVLCQGCYQIDIEAPRNWKELIEMTERGVDTFEHYETIVKSAKAQIEGFKKEKVDLERENTELNIKIDELLREISEKRVIVDEMENKLQARISKIPVLVSEISGYQDQITQLTDTLHEAFNGLVERTSVIKSNTGECKICSENKELFVNVPCGHTLCNVCIHTQHNCHICRQPIEKKIKIFL